MISPVGGWEANREIDLVVRREDPDELPMEALLGNVTDNLLS